MRFDRAEVLEPKWNGTGTPPVKSTMQFQFLLSNARITGHTANAIKTEKRNAPIGSTDCYTRPDGATNP
jgi:hypothetical protein